MPFEDGGPGRQVDPLHHRIEQPPPGRPADGREICDELPVRGQVPRPVGGDNELVQVGNQAVSAVHSTDLVVVGVNDDDLAALAVRWGVPQAASNAPSAPPPATARNLRRVHGRASGSPLRSFLALTRSLLPPPTPSYRQPHPADRVQGPSPNAIPGSGILERTGALPCPVDERRGGERANMGAALPALRWKRRSKGGAAWSKRAHSPLSTPTGTSSSTPPACSITRQPSTATGSGTSKPTRTERSGWSSTTPGRQRTSPRCRALQE